MADALAHSTLVSATRDTLTSNYATVAFVMVLLYDYTLTFRREVDYIWWQAWSMVRFLRNTYTSIDERDNLPLSQGKTLFLLNRYLPIIDLTVLVNCESTMCCCLYSAQS